VVASPPSTYRIVVRIIAQLRGLVWPAYALGSPSNYPAFRPAFSYRIASWLFAAFQVASRGRRIDGRPRWATRSIGCIETWISTVLWHDPGGVRYSRPPGLPSDLSHRAHHRSCAVPLADTLPIAITTSFSSAPLLPFPTPFHPDFNVQRVIQPQFRVSSQPQTVFAVESVVVVHRSMSPACCQSIRSSTRSSVGISLDILRTHPSRQPIWSRDVIRQRGFPNQRAWAAWFVLPYIECYRRSRYTMMTPGSRIVHILRRPREGERAAHR
jgi:hypothetical protein